MPRSLIAVAKLAILAACGGGGGVSSSGGAGVVPPVNPPTPIATSTPNIGTTVASTPVPAPADSSIPSLVAGGSSALPYIQSLGATIATLAPL